jgi:site-specific recombinase XerD
MDCGDYLFPSRKGGHITKQRADQIIKSPAKSARLRRNVHAHLRQEKTMW